MLGIILACRSGDGNVVGYKKILKIDKLIEDTEAEDSTEIEEAEDTVEIKKDASVEFVLDEAPEL